MRLLLYKRKWNTLCLNFIFTKQIWYDTLSVDREHTKIVFFNKFEPIIKKSTKTEVLEKVSSTNIFTAKKLCLEILKKSHKCNMLFLIYLLILVSNLLI